MTAVIIKYGRVGEEAGQRERDKGRRGREGKEGKGGGYTLNCN